MKRKMSRELEGQVLFSVPPEVKRKKRRFYKVSLPCGRGKKRHIHRTADTVVIATYVKYGRVCRPRIEIMI